MTSANDNRTTEQTLKTFADYVRDWATPFDDDDMPRYCIQFSWMLREMATLLILIASQYFDNDKQPTAFDVMKTIRAADMVDLDGIGLSINFQEFITWLFDEEMNIDDVIEDGAVFYVNKWNDFILQRAKEDSNEQ